MASPPDATSIDELKAQETHQLCLTWRTDLKNAQTSDEKLAVARRRPVECE